MPDHPNYDAGSLSLGDAERPLTSLEERVQRLEETVASLQNTAPLEDRLVTRVSERLRTQETFRPDRSGSTVEALPIEANLGGVPITIARPRWLLFDLIAEARTMVGMFFDFRHRPAWTAYLAVFGILPLILLSHYWFPLAYIPILGTFLDKILDLTLAFVLFKILSREVVRYRERHSR